MRLGQRGFEEHQFEQVNTVELAAKSSGIEIHTGIEEWSNSGSFPKCENGICLLKLHGSIDWMRLPITTPLSHFPILRNHFLGLGNWSKRIKDLFRACRMSRYGDTETARNKTDWGGEVVHVGDLILTSKPFGFFVSIVPGRGSETNTSPHNQT
jgi:hypothetical protein